MSKKPRCHDCGHKRGPRSLGAGVEKAEKPSMRRPTLIHPLGRTRKAPCGCACHQSQERKAA